MSTIYICLKPSGEPLMSISPVVSGCPSCKCQVATNYASEYAYHRKIYLENLIKQINEKNYILRVQSYNGYHDIAAYGNPRVSKRLLAPICPAIYNFRKTF
jgi:hypothetical protein